MQKIKPQTTFGFCKLCGLERELQESHIIPSFVTRYALKTSLTGGLRTNENPNQRVQDGEKARLLCYECEQRFSKHEDAFARSIFYPYHDKKIQSFAYDENTFRCAISIAWRALVHLMEDDEQPSEKVRSLERRAEKVWRHFLLGDISSIGNLKPRLFFLGSVSSDNSIYGFPPFANHYLARGIEIGLVGNSKGDNLFIYVKMMRLLLLGTVNRKSLPILNRSTIESSGGIIDASVSHTGAIPPMIRGYMSEQAESSAKALFTMSPKQIERVRHEIKANKEKVMKSESFQFFEAGSEKFGEAAFEDLINRQFPHNQ